MIHSDMDKAHGDSAFEEMRSTLVSTAREGRTITYGELAHSIRSVTLGPRSRALYVLLHEACDSEARSDRPMLGSVVVTKATGIPGKGYFDFARMLGHDISDERAFWTEELARVHACWAGSP